MPSRRRILTVFSALAVGAGTSPAVAAQPAPDADALAELEEGVRIRANGPVVREMVPPTVRDVFEGGLLSLVVRPPAEGVVVSATPQALRFTESQRDRTIDVPWSGIDYVDLYGGRSAGIGFLQGAAGGALGGLLIWGGIELIFFAADNPVVDDPELLVGLMAGGGALLGAATMGHRWERLHPTED